MKTPFVYMMASPSGTLYTGVTSNLERRAWEHKTHASGGFSACYNCIRLVYGAECASMTDAIAWEKSLKGKSRAKKEALIREQNPHWYDLASDWYR